MIANHLIWGIKLKASAEERARVMSLNAREMIVDKYLLVCSLGVISMVMLAFTTAHFIKLEAATIAMFGAAILLLLESFVHKPHKHSELVTHAFHEVEWITLFFFVGLFIVIGGVEHAGLLNMAANKLLSVTGGNLEIMTYGILWTSAILSAIVDNIPFVATMIPLINSVAPVMGGEHVIMPLWWALSLGACLGGNGTLVGASANLTVAGLAEKNGVHFSFVKFTALAFPMMLASIAIAHVYLMWRFF
jgi:Na+/H+ antiporter NhaD/arsenite permease-like protein